MELCCYNQRVGKYDDSWLAIKNCHYDLPNGFVGRDFVNFLSYEVNYLGKGST